MGKSSMTKISLVLAGLLATAGVYAQQSTAPNDAQRGQRTPPVTDNPGAAGNTEPARGTAARNSVSQNNASDAQKQVMDAVKVVNDMKRDPDAMKLLEQARGVFIIPDYGKAAAIVGGSGGEGVVLMRQERGLSGEWSPPAFFNIGGVSLGAEVGVEAGSIVMLLMSDKTTEMFMNQDNNFSLDANAGITIVNYSAKGQASAGKGDVVLWSDTKGAFVGAGIGVSDINRDEDENAAYYGKSVTAQEILSGNVETAKAKTLQDALMGPRTAANERH